MDKPSPADSLTLQDCDCSKLRDNLFQPVLKFRYECASCREAAIAEAVRENVTAMRGECALAGWRAAPESHEKSVYDAILAVPIPAL